MSYFQPTTNTAYPTLIQNIGIDSGEVESVRSASIRRCDIEVCMAVLCNPRQVLNRTVCQCAIGRGISQTLVEIFHHGKLRVVTDVILKRNREMDE